LQGGGALGAFECGVVKALEEAKIYPDIVAGVSMGAFNGAIIASNPRNATVALDAFWNELGVHTFDVPDESLRQMISSWQSLAFGAPRFFHPRWLMPVLGPGQLISRWTSFYDPSPVKALLANYVDFGRLKSSPVRLLVSAANVETAELEIFDSYVDDLTPDHILASGSLPPGFPWATINGKHYWDGGIVSNSPLEQVVTRCGVAGKRVFIVDLFPSRKRLPTDLMEVMARRDEIVYSERIRNDVRTRDLVRDFRKLVQDLLGHLDSATAVQIKQRPTYIQLMGDVAPTMITRIIRDSAEDEPSSRDYDFSRRSIEQRKQDGYMVAKEMLKRGAGPSTARAPVSGGSLEVPRSFATPPLS
jgi:predicted acylesterase/phospholipase RssA